nr:pentatricopeptide repeat protein AaPPR791 [Agave angustifolia]UPT49280.1 pentatricopeptide repeat protein AaPPR130 [Agave angustifolia]
MQSLISRHPHHHLLPLLPNLHHLPDLHQLHSHLLKSGLSLHPFLSTKLLAAAALLDTAYAHSLLHLLPSPASLFAFNCLLRGHSLSPRPDDPRSSFSLLNSLRSLALAPDPFSFIASLKSCARARCLPSGLQLHSSALRSGHYRFLNLRNALIHVYCCCGDMPGARQVFDEMPEIRDSVSWSTLMNGYLQICCGDEVVDFFGGMRRYGFEINGTAVVCLLSSRAAAGSSCEGGSVHGHCMKSGLCADLNVATVIAAMYVNLERLVDARMVFDETGRRDVVLYNCMVDGYAKGGYLEKCLSLLRQMNAEGTRINSGTLVGLLSACASSGALVVGQRVHEIAKRENLELDAALGTAILDMYVKCGCIDEAVEVFNQMQNRDVTAWTAMIMGLGIHGRTGDALQAFHGMEEEGVRPNDVTFLAALNACSHGGMVDSGKDFFKRMVVEYRMKPDIKHYGCVIDLLARAGLLQEAYELIRNLPLEGDAMAWRALLAACRVHGDVGLAKLAWQALVALGDEHPTDSILLTSMYASQEEWEDVGRMRDLEMLEMKMTDKKEAGYSLIEVS